MFFHYATTAFLRRVILCLLFGFSAYAQQLQNDQVPPGKLFGEMSLGLNDVVDGLTQTDKSPSLHAGFGYKWTQFKLGFYGQNVRYTDSDDALMVKVIPSYHINFTTKWDLTVLYQFRRSYKAGDHNDGVWDVDTRIFDYHVDYQIDDQWEATGTSASRLAVWRELPLAGNFIWHLEGGYNLTSTDRTDKYFDAKTAITYHLGDLDYSLVFTDSTANSDFQSRGGFQWYLQIAILL